MNNLMHEVYAFAQKMEQETGKRPVRIEMPGAEHCMKINGIEFWCDSSLAGRIFLKLHPQLIKTTEDEACL